MFFHAGSLEKQIQLNMVPQSECLLLSKILRILAYFPVCCYSEVSPWMGLEHEGTDLGHEISASTQKPRQLVCPFHHMSRQ